MSVSQEVRHSDENSSMIRHYGPGSSTTSAAIQSTGYFKSEAGVLRTRAEGLGEATAELHIGLTVSDLRARAAVKARNGVATLLRELAVERGMAWSDVARLVNVSVSAVRKWRTGGDASPEKRLQLAELAAFLDLLSESAIEDPAQWMEINLALPDGYAVRPAQLYLDGHMIALLEIAGLRRDPERVMDDIDPEWRTTWRSDFEVFMADDGQLAFQERQAGR
ncbi:hypothetical protein HRW16_19330 [Streptomyces lunaelactis]|uniref:helix-turn-helix domain-containing protein n=1 Tax=Streptomyces lunaelactis TaxID=1535768 RepID=UPI0015845F09|nr:helix-turn-helix transcriptional regulator [Streptomyces lunaelactis]NUK32517.1 hypothetical protein [Streptomyces lunaelactis]NUK93948.1 hypothetical protein [Streptomyces lunaelactis]NUL30192.1 hypothetical protein [Streptomyces lunaelactis]